MEREALPRDLLTLMLLHPSDQWDEDLVVREAILYLAASIGTSSTATTFAVAELDGWLREHPTDRSKLQDTAFLRRVANEVLRLRATFPAIMRRAVRDVTLRTGRHFVAGDRIAVINDAVNRDPSVFGADHRYFGVLDNAIVVKWSERDHAEVVREGLAAKAGFIHDFVAPSLERRRPLLAAYHAGSLDREQLPMDLLTLMLLHPQPEWDDDLLSREASCTFPSRSGRARRR